MSSTAPINTAAAPQTAAQQRVVNPYVQQPAPTGSTTDTAPANSNTGRFNDQTAAAADQVSISSAVMSKNLETVRAIEQMHATMNAQIKAVRKTNEQLNQSAEQLNAMQHALTTIVKNFPPFTMDSKERQELLMSYAAIRQELMKMTIPQPPPPLYQQVQHQWDATIGQNGQLLPEGVPALDTTSTDPQLHDSLAQLGSTGTALTELSSSITKALIGG